MISKLTRDEYTKCWHVALVHIGCKLLNCDLACNKIMDQQERVVWNIKTKENRSTVVLCQEHPALNLQKENVQPTKPWDYFEENFHVYWMAKNKVHPHLPKTCEGRRISAIEIHVRSNTRANERENKFHVYKIWIHKCIVITGFVQKDDKLTTK